MDNVIVHKAGRSTHRQVFQNSDGYFEREKLLRGEKPWTKFKMDYDEIIKFLDSSKNSFELEVQGLEIIFVRDEKGFTKPIYLPFIEQNPEISVGEILNSLNETRTPFFLNERFVIYKDEMGDYLYHLQKDQKAEHTIEFYLGYDEVAKRSKVVMQIIDKSGNIVDCGEGNTPIELP